MLKKYQKLREDIQPGAVYYHVSSTSELPKRQSLAIRSSRPSVPSPQIRLNQTMADNFLQNLRYNQKLLVELKLKKGQHPKLGEHH